jgi:hypothetical protein
VETLGLFLGFPMALGVSTIYSLLAVLFLSGRGAIGVLVRAVSWAVLAILALEAIGLAAFGAVRIHDRLGWVFTTVHVLALFLGAPAVANLVAGLGVARGCVVGLLGP